MWTVEHVEGAAGEVHARIPSADLGPTVWVVRVTAPALVLGSTQSFDHVDVAACEAAGIDVTRRRSGGGAVLLIPDEVLWLDVILPATHPAWIDDVVRSGWWLGDLFAAALHDIGVDDTHVHHGALVASDWSATVCFAGVGPGEVMIGRRKLIGISQRRTRTHARFQCALHHVWRPDLMARLVRHPTASPSPEDPLGADRRSAELTDVVATCDLEDRIVTEALVARLDTDATPPTRSTRHTG